MIVIFVTQELNDTLNAMKSGCVGKRESYLSQSGVAFPFDKLFGGHGSKVFQ